ncbi:FtsX-like permease family protein [Actinomyces israelii]|uniref:FtsX-like permease family protein n=1 Tax=Actinomyces israelii TaxID=1659 RepID=UPI002355AE9A|nr:FtsX-like permease family protein [Actinomyces israelii]
MPALLDTRRTAAALVAVAMSAALITLALVVSGSMRTQMQAGARLSVGGADVVVASHRGSDPAQGPLDDALVARVSALDGVASVRGTHWEVIELDLPSQLKGAVGATLAAQDVPALSAYTTLTAGRLPAAAGEVAIDATLAEQQGLGVGDTIRLRSRSEDRHDSSTESADGAESGADSTGSTDGVVHSSPTVVGVISPGADTGLEGISKVYATADQLAAMGVGTDYNRLYVTGRPGTDTSDLHEEVARVVHTVQSDAIVQDADEVIARRAVSFTGGGTVISTVLNLLAPVCALVAGIVIATTFTTLVARQNRVIGLLRCVGASRRQVRLAVLRTGLVTGLIGSAVGTAAGAAGAAVLIRSGAVPHLSADSLTVSPASLLAAVAAGTLVTLVSVLRPARRATRVSPLIALTGTTAAPGQTGRAHRWAAVTGLVVMVGGAAVTVMGTLAHDLYLTVGGGVLVALGVLAALPLLVTAVVGLIGRLGASGRYPLLHLAARNLVRNPGRSTATAATLLIGVMVGSALAVSLFSLNSSFQAVLAQSSPVDITVLGVTPQTDTTALTSTIRGIDGVQSTTVVPLMDLTQTVDGRSTQTQVIAVDTKAVTPMVRSAKGLEDLDDSTLIVGQISDIPDGTRVTLTGPGGSVELTAQVREGWGAAVTTATAARLTGGQATNAIMWVRATGDGSSQAVETAVRKALRGQDLMVNGSAAGRSAFSATLNQIVAVTALVMGSALVIALSGLANTTDVSVLERTREIGVLRATSTQRGEVRRLITTEATLLAGVGGALGMVTGTVLGTACTLAALGDGGVSVAVPYLPLAGILAVTLAVGVLASLRPAGRAAAVTPVTALAAD